MKKIKDICPEIFGITEKRYRQLASEGKLPAPKKGLVDFEVATKQYIALLRNRLESHDSTLTEQRRLKVLAEQQIKHLQLDELRGALIRRDEVVGLLVQRVVVLKTDLLSLPRRLAKYPEAKEIAHKYIIQLLKTYSRPTGYFKKKAGVFKK